ncbi:MAG: RnfABCDGE type electron transport complex subunit D [Pseudomonadales bacterium]|nr:RnfABCDGE type electron transport complex subunit D [Pseudomonadales bacterium]
MATLDTRRIMLLVSLCMVPGLVIQTLLFGTGVLHNLLLAVTFGLGTEAGCLKLLQRPIRAGLSDGSVLVTALLIAAALPPACPWFVLLLAVAAGICLGKYAYGGLGNNVFNPAMVGYAVVLVSFPAALAAWPALAGVPSVSEASVDALTGATALTALRFKGAATIEELHLAGGLFGTLGPSGWEWINLGYLLGGLILLSLRITAWRTSTGMLLALGGLAALTWDSGSSASHGSPLFHWLAGGTLLAAFFVVTDPVTHPTSRQGQWLFGLLVGSIVFLIRAFGNYPDGIAFAVLLANAMTPYLDRRLAGLSARV